MLALKNASMPRQWRRYGRILVDFLDIPRVKSRLKRQGQSSAYAGKFNGPVGTEAKASLSELVSYMPAEMAANQDLQFFSY